jgi:hypothetical protein
MLLACLACTRGRSWGVLALLGLAPALCALSYWGLPTRVSGCISTAHPFAEIGLVALAALALAVGPWLVPFARQLRSR